MKNIIVGIGEILWDVFPERKILGGAPANFAYHVSQLGFDGYAVSAIGNDENGNEIIENLHMKKLNHILEKISFPTGTVKVTLDGKGIPQYEICENVAWDNIPFTTEIENIAKQTKAVCYGSLAQRSTISRLTINKFLDSVQKDALKVFDINLRQDFFSQEIIEDSLKRCDILKINDDEIILVGQLFDWEELQEVELCKKILNNYDLKMVVLTKGAEGSYVITKEETSYKPTPIVKVADTVGAGDSFTASLVASFLNGKSIYEAHEIAVKVSAFVCTQHGAMPTFPETLLKEIT